MRIISFIVTVAVLFLQPTLAGSADACSPGIGTFEFSGFAGENFGAPFLIAMVR